MTGEAPRPFSDFHPGQTFLTPEHTLTAEEIVRFADLSGDHNPLHVDPEFARATRFGGIVGHGALSFSLLTGLWDRAGFMSGTVDAFVEVERLRFRLPVRPGDRLRARVTVVSTAPKGSGGMVTLDNELYNQEGAVVLEGRVRLLIRGDVPSRTRAAPPSTP